MRRIVFVIAFVAVSLGSVCVASPIDAPLGVVIAKEVADFRNATTLSDWRRAHPRDSVRPIDSRERDEAGEGFFFGSRGKVAVTASATVAGSGSSAMTRMVYFYPPSLQSLAAIPAIDTPAERLLDRAVPGYLWIEATMPDEKTATAVAAEAGRLLDAALGAGQPNARIAAWGTAFWRNQVLWKSGDIEVGIGISSGPTRATTGPVRVIVAASLPRSERPLTVFQRTAIERRNIDAHIAYDAATARLRKRVEEALDVARIGGEPEKAMRELLPYVVPQGFLEPPAEGDPDTLLGVFKTWMDTARALDPIRQAAALFAADQVLQGTTAPFQLAVHQGAGKAKSLTRREAFAAFGATFRESPLGATYLYTNPWLKQALAIDPAGRIGELAFLTLLEKGFDTSGVCAEQGTEGFKVVISKGETYLASARGQTSPDRATALFAVAQSYSDIVALAGGAGYDGPGGPDEKKFKPEAPRARQQALRYYRLALEAERDTPRAQEAWAEVWRLTANLIPSRTYFYCMYD
jgi:hypothetical protein